MKPSDYKFVIKVKIPACRVFSIDKEEKILILLVTGEVLPDGKFNRIFGCDRGNAMRWKTKEEAERYINKAKKFWVEWATGKLYEEKTIEDSEIFADTHEIFSY